MEHTRDSGNYQNAYEKHEERKRKLKEISEKYQYEALLKLASTLGISPEDILRILASVQGIDGILGRRIDLLWIEKFGTVHIKAPKSRLEPKELKPPRMPELGLKESSEFSYIDGLRDQKTGTFYFAANHRQIEPTYLYKYDGGMDEIRSYINSFFTEFLRHKNKSFQLYEAEETSFDTRLGTEVPPYRIYEMELIDIETESLKYGFKYGHGKILFTHGNAPYTNFAEIIKASGGYEQ